MNREIKFRAWDGFEMRELHGRALEAIETPELYAKKAIMQFTGFHDENGREIYDGDVLADVAYPDRRWQVRWVGGGWLNEWIQGMFIVHYFDHSTSDQEEKKKIIGNVWENPELLKGAT